MNLSSRRIKCFANLTNICVDFVVWDIRTILFSHSKQIFLFILFILYSDFVVIQPVPIISCNPYLFNFVLQFRFADLKDKILICVGLVFAIAQGAALPLMIIVFGEMSDLFIYDALWEKLARNVLGECVSIVSKWYRLYIWWSTRKSGASHVSTRSNWKYKIDVNIPLRGSWV